MLRQSWEVTFVRLESPFDAETSAQVKQTLQGILGRPGHVVLDLRGTTLDSTGLGALLGMQRQLEVRGRRLLVIATDPQFMALLQRAGVPHALALFPDAEQAVLYAGEHPCPAN